MADKVIHEVRIVETDDGFRIEIKGDKERLREMGFGKGGFPFGGFGPGGMGRGPWGHGHHGHHGPRGFGFPWGRHHWGQGGPWWAEEEDADKGKREAGPAERA
ncbi:MAG TPA: hypothetical protein VKQ72_07115 [Aggregatilineales bacterium]|nr:hypothetical protein [Aggregatilineales bacterium]